MKNEYDFRHAKRASEIDHLTQLRTAQTHQKNPPNMKTVADDSNQREINTTAENHALCDICATNLPNSV
jgi:hypothetical protein